MDSNTIGEIAKKTIELDLLKKGFKVSRVYGAMNKYDLLIFKNKTWKRVKIKTVQRWGDGPTQWSARKIDKTEVDIYATIDRVLDKNPIIEYIAINKKWWISDVVEKALDKEYPKEPPDIWCGDCGNLLIDHNITKGKYYFRCGHVSQFPVFGTNGRFLSSGTPPKPAPEWCPKRRHNVKKEKGL